MEKTAYTIRSADIAGKNPSKVKMWDKKES
jgi:hypothetical protein